ncbi:MAG: ATP-binding protein [Alphaproteobacteria bacterium]|nr:ATP-binding protein [Alphaproteobacteria bacterium]
MTTGSDQDLLVRIAAALERMAPPAPPAPDWAAAEAFIWDPAPMALKPVGQVARVPIGLLRGIDAQRDILLANTRRFAAGLPANNALLWGARGTGKSALVKAVHEAVRAEGHKALKLVEIHRDEVATMGHLLAALADAPVQAILFCDDLSFDSGDSTYRALKTLLDGGIAGRPPNVLFYATSNRRHLMPQEMIDNERASAIHPGEAIEEKVSLSDRFGLWLGFHNITQQDFLAMVEAYARHFALNVPEAELKRRAIEWSMTRGSRSGRVAWQFIEDLAGERGQRLAVSVTR